MNTIFVIDKDIKECIGSIDFIPHREERFLFNSNEYKIACVLYHPKEHSILVFVTLVDRYYSNMIKDIKWNI
jgi:hypothetical protein